MVAIPACKFIVAARPDAAIGIGGDCRHAIASKTSIIGQEFNLIVDHSADTSVACQIPDGPVAIYALWTRISRWRYHLPICAAIGQIAPQHLPEFSSEDDLIRR